MCPGEPTESGAYVYVYIQLLFTQLWSHMPLSSAATLEYSGGPPSRRRFTRQEFLRLSMSEDSDENGMADDVPEQVSSKHVGDEGGNEGASVCGLSPPGQQGGRQSVSSLLLFVDYILHLRPQMVWLYIVGV